MYIRSLVLPLSGTIQQQTRHRKPWRGRAEKHGTGPSRSLL